MTTNKTVLSTIKKDHHIEKVDLKAYSKNDLESINIIVKKAVIDSNAPRTPEELWNCIKINFGIEIPLTSTSEEFNAPFEWLWNFWTEKHESSFAVGPRGGLKCLATTTPILTHNRGWITMGEIVVGDYVYDVCYKPTKVLEVSDVHYDKECYSVSFDRAESIVCSSDHLWKTHALGRQSSVKTTEEIYNTQYDSHRISHSPKNLRMYTPHAINGVEKVATVPTVCILIEHPEHLFLAGRSLVPTHNTYPSTIMTYMFSRFRKDYESITAGALKKHSAVSQKYLRGFFKDPALKPYFSKSPTATSAEWVTGSTWNIVTGTTSGISGDHPQLLCMDEIEFWPIDAIGQALSLPISKGENKAQLHMFSTRQKAYGSSNWLTTQIESGEKDIKLYSWSIFEVMQPCKSCLCIKGGRTISEPEKTCTLWDDCRGVKGMKSTGIYTREYVCKKKKDLTQEEWETQYLCLRPSSHGLVLYNFSHEEMAPGDINKGNYCAWEYLPDQPYYIIHDPAEGHKSVMIFVQFWNDRMFIFDEIIDKESYSITKCKVQLQERIKEMGYAYPEFIIPDPHRTDAGKEWTDGSPSGTGSGRSYKVQYPKMEGDYKNIEPGIDLLRTAILNGSGKRSLYINKKNCPGIIDAVREHHYKTGMDNSLSDAAKPDAAFKDEVDTMRYGVIWAKQRRLMFIREQTAMIRSLG